MNCQSHANHEHKHGENCGHVAIKHDDHTDYLHEGHLHFVHGEHTDEHQIAESVQNPSACTPEHNCHEQTHQHGADCGHQAIPHGTHVDYLVDGHLHHPCSGHCDDHGKI